MSGLLDGRVALVTGGGGGLGRCHALALAAAGASVVVNDLGRGDGGDAAATAPADLVVAEIRAAGGTAIANRLSVADWDAGKAIVQSALDAFGRLDILVNNAGIMRFTTLDAGTRDDWDMSIAVNLTGSAAMTYWAAQHWKAAGPAASRAIVNTTSPAGTGPGPGAAAYCVSKAGVIALTLTSAGELARLGVRVNAIAPLARTPMTNAMPMLDDVMRRPDEGFDRVAPEHASPLVVHLASPACRFTGRVFGIEGDDLYLFDGFSANRHFNNAKRQWTPATLAAALSEVDVQDRGYTIAPGGRVAAGRPSADTLHLLAGVSRS